MPIGLKHKLMCESKYFAFNYVAIITVNLHHILCSVFSNLDVFALWCNQLSELLDKRVA